MTMQPDYSNTIQRGYALQQQIARTERGAVYFAFRKEDNLEVAIKVLPISPEIDENSRKRFQLEAVIAFRLKHPNIVPLLDYWSDEHGIWLVLQWMRGGSLREHLRSHGAMSPQDVLRLLRNLGAALTMAHSHHIVHRDIKPDNILFDGQQNAYLTDFGVAKRMNAQDITEPDATIGSPAYYSPEQIRKWEITPQTDLYALGIVTHEALIGVHPFGKLFRSMQVIMHHLNEPMPPLTLPDERLAQRLDVVLQKATQKEANLRYERVLDFVSAFQQALYED